MTRLWSHIALGLLAVIGLGLYGQEQRRRGAAEAEGARWKRQADSLAKVAAKVDTIYRIQRDTFYIRRDRWDTAFVDVERWKHDTTEVVRYVSLADSTIKACTLALQSCDAREALRLGQIRAWERRWETRDKPRPAWQVWLERAAIAGVSYNIGRSMR